MKLEDRIAKHRRMAEAYRDAYTSHDVHGGGQYAEWVYAADAIYSSPYFTGDQVIALDENLAVGAALCATMEARAYTATFSDWGPAEFKCWPSDNGFVMRTRWEGTTHGGKKMGFYSIGFVDTNENCEITRWETFPNDEEYGPFLELAIGMRGPFANGTDYVDALVRTLERHGLS